MAEQRTIVLVALILALILAGGVFYVLVSGSVDFESIAARFTPSTENDEALMTEEAPAATEPTDGAAMTEDSMQADTQPESSPAQAAGTTPSPSPDSSPSVAGTHDVAPTAATGPAGATAIAGVAAILLGLSGFAGLTLLRRLP